jgi:hypothetical protein
MLHAMDVPMIANGLRASAAGFDEATACAQKLAAVLDDELSDGVRSQLRGAEGAEFIAALMRATEAALFAAATFKRATDLAWAHGPAEKQ